ncbi:MAG: hypothetical protein ABFE01_24155 [Phycisphaerales bacterium]
MEPRACTSTLDDPLTEYERSIGVPERCRQVFRVLAGRVGCCPRRDGLWPLDAIVELTRHHSHAKKAREFAVECPSVVERAYLDRKTGLVHYDRPGDKIPAIERCAKPIALFGLTAEYDPRRRHEMVEQAHLFG